MGRLRSRLLRLDDPGSTGGWCDTEAKRIIIDANAPANARLRALVHEAIHALGIDYQRYARAQAEVIVDTTRLVVLGGLGRDVCGADAGRSPRWRAAPPTRSTRPLPVDADERDSQRPIDASCVRPNNWMSCRPAPKSEIG